MDIQKSLQKAISELDRNEKRCFVDALELEVVEAIKRAYAKATGRKLTKLMNG